MPIGLTAFGADRDDDARELIFPIVEPRSLTVTESAKALMAGYRGTTSHEFLDWGLRRAAEHELVARPERLKVLVVIHDGQPVYNGRRGNNWELSLVHLRQMESAGITPIGVYLGTRTEDQRKLRQLFRWLVVCTGEQLPATRKLGDLLRSLA